MDPITGIGLAASVIQLVTFSIDAVKTCREMYQQGSVSECSNLDYTTGNLVSLATSLEQSLETPSTRSQALSREEKDLVDLCRKCGDCAKRLQKELRKLETQPRSSAFKAFRQTARAIWKRSNIDKIQTELEMYQSTLEMSLLSRLSQRFDTQSLRNDKSFADLDKSLQRIITRLASGQKSLKSLVVQESEQTRHLITTQIDRMERLHVDERRYEEITQSLFYPDIFSRREQVDTQFDGIKNSYDWIFDKPQISRSALQSSAPRWDDFARWLRSGHGVYWIQGKAGSGKSTLMNHICNHKRKSELLKEWCCNRLLLTPTFFFWNAGSRLQKSIDGLLRSLVYQMLRECRELIGLFDNVPLYSWTQHRLKDTLLSILRQSQVPIAVCMFVDGLDEFEDREDIVIDLVKVLADQANVKICLSSRPLPIFEEAFNERSSLRLQDLTFGTISEYAENQLSKPIQMRVSLEEGSQYMAEKLLRTIVERADGVFLWVIIAIRHLREGLQGFADLCELARTIETLPSELESLLILMLRRIKPPFKRDAAYFLGVALQQGDDDDFMDLCRLHLSHSQRVSEDAPFYPEEITTSKLVRDCRILEKRLLSHTAGLLELTPRKNGGEIYQKRKDLDPVLFTKIYFLHRTARDFLLENDEAKTFLANNGLSEAHVHLSIARGTLAQLAHFSQGEAEIMHDSRCHPIFFPFYKALHHISIVESLVGVSQAKLMQSLDYEYLARGYPFQADDSVPSIEAEAFMVGRSANSIEKVGMAASVGMSAYVCEQLGLKTESKGDRFSFPDLDRYSRNRLTAATLSWNRDDQLRDKVTGSTTRLPPLAYRQALARCLQWERGSSLSSQTDTSTKDYPIAETYMLACCEPWSIDRSNELVRVLLRAGANPLVNVRSFDLSPRKIGRECFWGQWLVFLADHLDDHRRSTGRFQGLMCHNDDTFNKTFDITKGLIAQGADINYQMTPYSNCLKGNFPPNFRFRIELSVSAMFLLEECFSAEPEFREFAITIEPLIERPTREIEGIYPHVNCRLPESGHYYIAPPNTEREFLWPHIEKWEDTGSRADLYALNSALETVWSAHFPGVRVREEGEDLILESESDDNDESDDDDDGDNDEGHEDHEDHDDEQAQKDDESPSD